MTTPVRLFLLRGDEVLLWKGKADSSALVAKGSGANWTARSVRGGIPINPKLERYTSWEEFLAGTPPLPDKLELCWHGSESGYWPFRHPSLPKNVAFLHAEAVRFYNERLQVAQKSAEDDLAQGLFTWDTILKVGFIALLGFCLLIGANWYFGSQV